MWITIRQTRVNKVILLKELEQHKATYNDVPSLRSYTERIIVAEKYELRRLRCVHFRYIHAK